MRILFFIFFKIITSVILMGQSPSLSLEEAVKLGLQHNFDIQIERQNVAITQLNNVWGETGFLPTITLAADNGNSLTNNVKTASPFQLQDITLANSFTPSINLNWVLFDGFRARITKARLEQLEAESEGNAAIVVENTLQAIVLAYYAAVLEKERVAALEYQLNISRDRWQQSLLRNELGAESRSEALVTEGNFLSDSLSLISQKLALRNVFRTLNVLIQAEDENQSYQLTDQLLIKNDVPSLESLKAKLNSTNPDLQRLYLTQSVLKTTAELAASARLPSITLNTGFSESRSRVDLSNASFPNGDGTFRDGPTDPLNAITDNIFVNLRLSFTLYNGGRINRAIKTAQLQEDIGEMRIDRLQLTLNRDLAQNYDQYVIRKQIVDINTRREEVAKINLDLSNERFKNGTINSFDYRIVQNTYLQAVTTRLIATYSLMESQIALLRLSGSMLATFQ